MSALQRFENRLEEVISNVFARTFRSAVQPVEISAALNREVDNSAQILSRERRLVPNAFHVELSPSDHERLAQLGDQLIEELSTMLEDHAARQSYLFTGPLSIELEESEDLPTGRFRVRSQSLSSVRHGRGENARPVAPTSTEVRRAAAVLVVNGEQLPLTPPGIVVGRGNDADLRIEDPGVSRRHAEIRVVETASGPRVSVADLGSTNGLVVDGRRVSQATLSDGSTVRIGNTTMTLRQTDPRAGGGG
ncbi:MAG: FhaA domain-containing protein [Marmoricola sp.]